LLVVEGFDEGRAANGRVFLRRGRQRGRCDLFLGPGEYRGVDLSDRGRASQRGGEQSRQQCRSEPTHPALPFSRLHADGAEIRTSRAKKRPSSLSGEPCRRGKKNGSKRRKTNEIGFR